MGLIRTSLILSWSHPHISLQNPGFDIFPGAVSYLFSSYSSWSRWEWEMVLFSNPVNPKLEIFSLNSAWTLNGAFWIYFSIFSIYLSREKKPINTVNILPDNLLGKTHSSLGTFFLLNFLLYCRWCFHSSHKWPFFPSPVAIFTLLQHLPLTVSSPPF